MLPFSSLSVLLHGDDTPAEDVAIWLQSIQTDYSHLVSVGEVETLVRCEIAGQGKLLKAWQQWFGLDMHSLHVGNVFAKRVLYTHKPYIFPAPWRASLPIVGTNSRQHLAVDDGSSPRSTRFEAISELRLADLRSYYAFKIQYRTDRRGRRWQVLFPSLFLDREVYALILGLPTSDGHRLVTALRLLLSFASHDYVHGTIMRWFPAPTLASSPQYAILMSETGPPSALSEWHAALSTSRQVRLRSGETRDIRDILEYQAAYIHLRNLEHVFAADATAVQMVMRLAGVVDRLLSESASKSERNGPGVRHLGGLVTWFLLGIMRLDRLCDAVAGSSFTTLSVERTVDTAGRLFWGFYEIVNNIEEDGFMWDGEFRDIRTPFVQYGACLHRALLGNP